MSSAFRLALPGARAHGTSALVTPESFEAADRVAQQQQRQAGKTQQQQQQHDAAEADKLRVRELRAIGQSLDGFAGENITSVDLLTDSPPARKLLAALLAATSPLLPKHVVSLLIAVTPMDGVTAALERAQSVLASAPPFNSHVAEALLELVCVSASTPSRTVLLLSLLTPLLLGRDAIEARDDGGLSACLGAHLLLTRTLHTASVRGMRGVLPSHPLTVCVQLPIASVRGATFLFEEALMEGVPIERRSHESTTSMLGRHALPLSQAILVVATAPAAEAAAESPWDFAAPPASPGGLAARARRLRAESAAAATPGAGPPTARALASQPTTPQPPPGSRDDGGGASRGFQQRLRAGDCVISVDGRLLTPSLAQLITLEAKHGSDGTKATAATIRVLRALEAGPHAKALIEQRSRGASPERAARSHSPSPDRAAAAAAAAAPEAAAAARRTAGGDGGGGDISALGFRGALPSAPSVDADRSTLVGSASNRSSSRPSPARAARAPRAAPPATAPIPAATGRCRRSSAGAAAAPHRAEAAAAAAAAAAAVAAATPSRAGRDGDNHGPTLAETAGGAPLRHAASAARMEAPRAAAAVSGHAPRFSPRDLPASASLESLRGHLLQEARERAVAEGAALLKKHSAEAQREAERLIEAAEVEAEAVRLRKRSQTQAEAEEELREAFERQKRREVAEIVREHKATIERLQSEHGATVLALRAAMDALEKQQLPEHAERLAAFADAVSVLQVPPTPSATDSESTNSGEHAQRAPPKPATPAMLLTRPPAFDTPPSGGGGGGGARHPLAEEAEEAAEQLRATLRAVNADAAVRLARQAQMASVGVQTTSGGGGDGAAATPRTPASLASSARLRARASGASSAGRHGGGAASRRLTAASTPASSLRGAAASGPHAAYGLDDGAGGGADTCSYTEEEEEEEEEEGDAAAPWIEAEAYPDDEDGGGVSGGDTTGWRATLTTLDEAEAEGGGALPVARADDTLGAAGASLELRTGAVHVVYTEPPSASDAQRAARMTGGRRVVAARARSMRARRGPSRAADPDVSVTSAAMGTSAPRAVRRQRDHPLASQQYVELAPGEHVMHAIGCTLKVNLA